MLTLDPKELQQKLLDTLVLIDGDEDLLPEINNSNEFAKPYIEIHSSGYDYVCRERNEELYRKMPFDTEELMFLVFSDITFAMASQWEVHNRNENEDFRIQLFAKQVELMEKIDTGFGSRIKGQLESYLK